VTAIFDTAMDALAEDPGAGVIEIARCAGAVRPTIESSHASDLGEALPHPGADGRQT
jgi:hypothetical protein